MAWESCTVPGVSNNFDLDYSDNVYNSEFRANASGWVAVTFTTYCSTAPVAASVPIPLFGPLGSAILVSLLGFFGYRKLKHS